MEVANPKLVLNEDQDSFTMAEVFQNYDFHKINGDIAHDVGTMNFVKALMNELNRHARTDAEAEAFMAGAMFDLAMILSDPDYAMNIAVKGLKQQGRITFLGISHE